MELPRILIIDDYEDLVKSYILFYKHTFNITHAGSIREAFHYLQDELFDVIVVDYYLPDGFGVEITGMIDDDTPIILLSGDMGKIEQYGSLFDAAFFKPIDLNVLEDAILSLVDE